MQFWYPNRKEIQDWLEKKETEFAEKENRNPRVSTEAWLDKYIFTDEHEIFFDSLLGELHEWLSMLAETKCYMQSDKPAECMPEASKVLKKVDNSISQAVDYWIAKILEGFVTEFTVDQIKSYSEAERHFFKGLRGKFLNSLSLWIKMLLCDHGILML
jgi:hypothetical protein